MRLMLLVAGFVFGSTVVAMGVVRTSLGLVTLGILLAVPTGAALQPELGKERYAAGLERGRRRLRLIGEYLRHHAPMAIVGGVAGLIVGGLTLGWWDAHGLPVGCQDLFFPDPPVCSLLFSIGGRVVPFLVAVGVFLGWRARRRSAPRGKRISRVVFEVFGRLVALGAIILGTATVLIPMAFEVPRLENIPWLDLTAVLAEGLAAVGGGLLYALGLNRRTVHWVSAQRAIGWLMFSVVLLLPLLTRTYLTRWWIQGALLSAIALPAIATWGELASGDNSPLIQSTTEPEQQFGSDNARSPRPLDTGTSRWVG